MKQDNDNIDIADTLCSEQTLLGEDEQTAQLSHSSMAHFKIVDILGKGGMGAVYKAKDLALERFVAIKMIRINDTKQSLMLAEAKTISQLNHPNIVTVYDIAREDEANFIVMEWVNGQALNTVIPPHGLPVTTVVAYAKQMVAAIACAHQQNIIHRDIKPQNIMVEADGRIKILDFGIAALIDSAASTDSTPLVKTPTLEQETATAVPQPRTAQISGSPQYMAPEQINGQASDARSDLFSLGIVLYEMLTGVKPFLGLNYQQITQAILNGKYTPIAECKVENKAERKQPYSAELIALVDKLLQTEPAARYQSAAVLAQDIEVIDEQINHKKNWWQQQHQITKMLIVLPLIAILAWSLRSVLFPPSTQELIARQLVESKKIAFIPFDNISGDPVLQIFSDGMATMLSSDLAEVGYQQGDGSTWVLPASEIRRLEDPSISGVYNKYGVDVIITGSIQHMGSTRSLHLSLINGADGRQLKSLQLTIDANNLFGAQTQIRQQVMGLLGWQIPSSLVQQFSQQKPAFDGAYKHYLQGQGYLYRFDHGDNINQALKSFQAAIELDENYADAYVGLAQAQRKKYIKTKDTSMLTAMNNTVEQLLAVDHSHHLLSYLQGELMLMHGDYSGAIKFFEKSIGLQANFFMSYSGLSASHLKLGQSENAEEILLTAYQSMPNNNFVLIELGAFYFEKGDYDRAIGYFEMLAAQTPNNYTAYLNISACHYLNGDIEQAILSAKQALIIQPNDIVYSNIGTYYFILKNYVAAVESFEQMIALNDTNYINWGNLADAYRFAKSDKYLDTYKQAISVAKQALKLNPYNKNAIASLSYYYANVAAIEQSNFYASKIIENDSGADNFLIAAAYARLGMQKIALKHLEFAINNNYSIAEISSSPLFNSLKSEPEYLQLIATDSE